MKLFIKDHLSFVLLYVINFMFILLVFGLSGEYLSSQLMIYMLLLCLFTLFIFLTIRYYKKATVYKTLSIPSSNLRSMKKRLQNDALQKLLHETNKQHSHITDLFRENKIEELKDFLAHTHWTYHFSEVGQTATDD